MIRQVYLFALFIFLINFSFGQDLNSSSEIDTSSIKTIYNKSGNKTFEISQVIGSQDTKISRYYTNGNLKYTFDVDDDVYDFLINYKKKEILY